MGAAYVGVTMPQVFPSIYTATKVFGCRLATAYHREYDIPVSHVRAFNAFGPGQKYGPGHPQKIVPTFAIHAWNNEPIPIWGDGSQGVDLIHTRDLAEMFWWAWQVGGDDFTIDGGSGFGLSVIQVANLVLAHTGSTAGVKHLPMRRGEEPTEIVAECEGWDRVPWWASMPSFRPPDLAATIDFYKGVSL
jgi:UDP-glucose 4-epimerase